MRQVTGSPRTVGVVAAALLALEGAGSSAAGIGFVVAALVAHPHDRGTAALLGALLVGLGLACLAIARGLVRAKPRARTPAYLVQFFAVVVGVGQVRTLPEVAIPVLVVAAAAVVALTLSVGRGGFRQ